MRFYPRGLIILGMCLFLVSPLFAAKGSQYGTFDLKNGKGYIIRSGKKLNLSSLKSMAVFNNDLIKLNAKSNGVLTSTEKAVIDVGSNAVMRVRSWKEDNNRGFLSLLYGKIKATISGLRANESFNIKTANSVIGVKGTEYSAGVNYEGNSFVWTIEDYTYLTDVVRKKQMIVPNGYYAANIRGDGLQKMVAVRQSAVDINQLGSSKPGDTTRVSFTDDFYQKRDNVGKIPFVDQEFIGKTVVGGAEKFANDIKIGHLIEITIKGQITGDDGGSTIQNGFIN